MYDNIEHTEAHEAIDRKRWWSMTNEFDEWTGGLRSELRRTKELLGQCDENQLSKIALHWSRIDTELLTMEHALDEYCLFAPIAKLRRGIDALMEMIDIHMEWRRQ